MLHDQGYCGTKTVVQWKGDQARTWEVQCRSWHCPRCAPRRRDQLRWLARGGNPRTFVTLTCNPAIGDSQVSRARAMADGWRKLVRRIKAAHGLERLEYLVVVEATQRGEPHLHILLKHIWIDQRWLSKQWQELTGAFIVDIRRVKDDRRISSYVAKYIGKAPHQFGSVKRYWHTKDWDERERDHEERKFWLQAETHTSELNHGEYMLIMISEGWQQAWGRQAFARWVGPPGSHAPPIMQ
jgi:hypothetical protein